MPESTQEAKPRADAPDWALSPQERASRAARTERPPRLDIGRAISRAFGAIGANFGAFFFLAVLFAALPTVIWSLGAGFLLPAIASSTGSSLAFLSGILPLASAVVLAIPSYILIGALTQGSMVFYNGGKASFGDCLSTGLRFVLPLLGLGVVTVLGVVLWLLPMLFGLAAFGAISGGLGALGLLLVFPLMILLAIPVTMAAVRWSVSAPALVVERLGVIGAFRRSIDLTSGSRWRIFWLVVIYGVLSSLIQGVFTFLSVSITTTAADSGLDLAWIVFGAAIFYASFNSMILATGAAAIYFELRTTKEGATANELAKVFE